MSLDIEATLCLGSCCQRGKKYDRRVFQFGVSVNSCCYFAAVLPWHHDIEQDYIRPEIQGAPMSPGSLVFFQHQIVTGLFEKNLYQVSGITVVIEIRMHVFLVPERPIEPGQEKAALGSRGREKRA